CETAPMPTPLPISDRPIRLAVVGLGQISKLMLPPYLMRPEVEVVALCDRDPACVADWADIWPNALTTDDPLATLTAGPDVVDVRARTPLHGAVRVPLLEAGVHVQVQKPIARTVKECDRMRAAAHAGGATLRVLEDYLFFPPLVKLREIVASGEIGTPAAMH